MKKSLFKWSAIASLTIVSSAGCSSEAKLVAALAKDPASWTVHVSTPWGTADYTRTGWTVVTNQYGYTSIISKYQQNQK
jgi:hypothetical protein